MKTNTLTARDNEIIATATHYRLVHGKARSEFPTVAAAKAAQAPKQGQGRGALLYAVGQSCGVAASALVASYKPGTGWADVPAEPPAPALRGK